VRGISGNRRPLHAQAAIADRASRRLRRACLAAPAFTMLIPSQRIITKDNVSIDTSSRNIRSRFSCALCKPWRKSPLKKNSTIIFPAQFMTTVQEAFATLTKDSATK